MIRHLLSQLTSRRHPTTAEEWAARLQSLELGRHEQKAFDAWLMSDPRNAEEYARCNKIGYLAAQLKLNPALVELLPAYAALQRKHQPRPRFAVALAGATALCLISLAVYLLPAAFDLYAPQTVIATVHGEQRQVPLEDGTRVHINTESKLRVAYSAAERRVELQSGEAFFEVTKDAARPFVVKVGDSEIRVIGTRFGVHLESASLAVVVSEGKVNVVPELGRHSANLPDKVALLPGQELRLDRTRGSLQVVSVNAERVTAWHKGVIDFDSATLEDVLADVNRYARQEFVIKDDRLKGIRLSGRFNIGDVDSVKFALATGFGITAVESGGKILLQRE